MKDKFVIRKCTSCGALVKVFKDCTCEDCGIQCCGKEMKKIVPNTAKADKEKHVPTYQVYGEKIMVRVNHVMEPDHYMDCLCK